MATLLTLLFIRIILCIGVIGSTRWHQANTCNLLAASVAYADQSTLSHTFSLRISLFRFSQQLRKSSGGKERQRALSVSGHACKLLLLSHLLGLTRVLISLLMFVTGRVRYGITEPLSLSLSNSPCFLDLAFPLNLKSQLEGGFVIVYVVKVKIHARNYMSKFHFWYAKAFAWLPTPFPRSTLLSHSLSFALSCLVCRLGIFLYGMLLWNGTLQWRTDKDTFFQAAWQQRLENFGRWRDGSSTNYSSYCPRLQYKLIVGMGIDKQISILYYTMIKRFLSIHFFFNLIFCVFFLAINIDILLPSLVVHSPISVRPSVRPSVGCHWNVSGLLAFPFSLAPVLPYSVVVLLVLSMPTTASYSTVSFFLLTFPWVHWRLCPVDWLTDCQPDWLTRIAAVAVAAAGSISIFRHLVPSVQSSVI